MKHLKKFNESPFQGTYPNIEIIEDYIISLIDDGFVLTDDPNVGMTTNYYTTMDSNSYQLHYRSKPFFISDTYFRDYQWIKKLREEIENEMNKIEVDLFTSAKRITKNTKSFGYSTFIGLSEFKSKKKEHVRGYIENFQPQEAKIIDDFAVKDYLNDYKDRNISHWGTGDNTFYIWVELRINRFEP